MRERKEIKKKKTDSTKMKVFNLRENKEYEI